jgi:hypothetical protein
LNNENTSFLELSQENVGLLPESEAVFSTHCSSPNIPTLHHGNTIRTQSDCSFHASHQPVMEAIRQKHVWIFRLYALVTVIIQLVEKTVKEVVSVRPSLLRRANRYRSSDDAPEKGRKSVAFPAAIDYNTDRSC